MADTKISDLANPSGGPASSDEIHIVDKSDTADGAGGSSRKTALSTIWALISGLTGSQFADAPGNTILSRALSSTGVPDWFLVTNNSVPARSGTSALASIQLDANELLGRTASGNLNAWAPQEFTFTNSEANGGNPTLKVAPEDTAQVSNLADITNADFDFAIGADGIYKASISIVLELSGGGDRTWAGAVDFKRATSTVTLIGSAVPATTGDSTGLTISISGSASNLRVSITNATGATVNGYIHYGAIRSDLVS